MTSIVRQYSIAIVPITLGKIRKRFYYWDVHWPSMNFQKVQRRELTCKNHLSSNAIWKTLNNKLHIAPYWITVGRQLVTHLERGWPPKQWVRYSFGSSQAFSIMQKICANMSLSVCAILTDTLWSKASLKLQVNEVLEKLNNSWF